MVTGHLRLRSAISRLTSSLICRAEQRVSSHCNHSRMKIADFLSFYRNVQSELLEKNVKAAVGVEPHAILKCPLWQPDAKRKTKPVK